MVYNPFFYYQTPMPLTQRHQRMKIGPLGRAAPPTSCKKANSCELGLLAGRREGTSGFASRPNFVGLTASPCNSFTPVGEAAFRVYEFLGMFFRVALHAAVAAPADDEKDSTNPYHSTPQSSAYTPNKPTEGALVC